MEPPLLSFDAAINIIFHRNAVPPESSIVDHENFDIHQYLQALDIIQQSVRLADYESQAEEAILMAVARLKLEFLILLTRVTEVTKNPSSATLSSSIPLSGSTLSTTGWSSTSAADGVHETYIANNEQEFYNLRSIAEGMKSAGYVGECVEVCKRVRKPFVDASFKSFGIQKLSVADVRGFVWFELRTKIRTWRNAVGACVLLLFPRERDLCHGIFENDEEADVCFVETVKDAVIQLFQFAEAVSTTRRSPEKLFMMLDMYEALVDLSPVVDGVFGNELPDSRRLRDTFAEIVREILSEFEMSLFHELSPMTEDDRGGRIHPLTEYAMGNIIQMVEEHKEILSELILSTPPLSFGNLMISDAQLKGQTPLAQHLILIIAVLQMKLEGKSKYYKDASLVHFFMTNNVYYIVRCIYHCEAEEMIGEDYMKKLIENLREAISRYLGSTCERILKCLGEKGDAHASNCISLAVSTRSRVKKKIKLFNAMLEELLSTQASWGIQDWYFRKVLRSSISNRLIPAYRSFLERFDSHLERRNHPYIKYSVEDLQTLISNNIFLGKNYVDGVIMLGPSGEDKLWNIITGSPRSFFHEHIF